MASFCLAMTTFGLLLCQKEQKCNVKSMHLKIEGQSPPFYK